MPFVGTLLEVHEDHVLLTSDESDPDSTYRASRESRPLVDGSQI